MIDAAFLVGFIVLPVVAIYLVRSITWFAVAFTFTIALLGTALQTSVKFGINFNYRGTQVLLLAAFATLVVFAWFARRPARVSLKRQFLVVGLPMLAIAAVIIGMRLMAEGSPGPLTGLGFLVNHPVAEDNAKWLNLASQLASGREMAFNGYAGGPLILIMVLVATLVATLSQILLGGFNEVAVAINTVIGTQFLLIALVPLALAPFAEGRVPPGRMGKAAGSSLVPAPLVWTGMVVLGSASAVLTTYGHLSLQFVILMLALWAAVFLVRAPMRRGYLLATLVTISTAAVWFPLNGLAIILLAGCWVVVIRSIIATVKGRRGFDWLSAVAVVLVTITTWDALISSTLYAIGFGSVDAAAEGGSGLVAAGSRGVSAVAGIATKAFPLFENGGGTEVTGPVLGLLTAVSVIAAAVLYATASPASRLRRLLPFTPVIALIAYALLIGIGDALVTGSAPHYGTQKMGFAVAVVVLAVTLPAAFMVLDARKTGLTLTRGLAALVVLFVLVVDTLLPRGLSAMSSALWPAPDPAKPAYWSAAEVKPVADQPISSTPLGCVFLPNGAVRPSGEPDGQLTYSCSRLLIGLSGIEGQVGGFMDWIGTDWLSNGSFWDEWYGAIGGAPDSVKAKKVILLDPTGKIVGFETLGGLLNRFPPPNG